MQNDAGSTVVFMALIFVFYREGIPQKYLLTAFTLLIISIATLKFSALSTWLAVSILVIIYQFFVKKKKKKEIWNNDCSYNSYLLCKFCY